MQKGHTLQAVDEKVQLLRERLGEIDRVSDDEWMQSLTARKLEEIEFHNRDRDREQKDSLDTEEYQKYYGNKKYYEAVGAADEYLFRWIDENAPKGVFLDYACGAGGNAMRAAEAGAPLALGLDISSVSVMNCRSDAKARGLQDRTYFFQADAENTMLPDGCVDRVICSGMLHHLDLSYCFPELRRILAPGGRILCMEALNYNPAIKLYRMMTPEMRTEWEKAHILSLKDVRFAKNFFDIGDVRYFHILGIAAPHLKPLAPFLHAADRVLEKIPGIQQMAWMFSFELVKKDED